MGLAGVLVMDMTPLGLGGAFIGTTYYFFSFMDFLRVPRAG